LALLGIESSKSVEQQFDRIRGLLSHNDRSAEFAG
jgi:hypothetical protein